MPTYQTPGGGYRKETADAKSYQIPGVGYRKEIQAAGGGGGRNVNLLVGKLDLMKGKLG